MCVVQCKPSHLAEVDISRYCMTYLLSKKSEVLDKFKEFKVAIEKETGMNILRPSEMTEMVNICLRN